MHFFQVDSNNNNCNDSVNNNNNKKKNHKDTKRPLRELDSYNGFAQQNKSKRDDNTPNSDAKRQKIITSTPFENKKSLNSVMPASSSSSPSNDIIIVLDSSVDSTGTLVVDSSVADSTHNGTGYSFDALRTDDETDLDETSNAPYWSLARNRKALVTDQEMINSEIVDKFFGSKAQTVNSRDIFPNSVPIQRRRSTAVWNTPPRYSILPKY